MVRTAKRIDSTDAYDTSTYSIAIIEVPNLSLVSVDIGDPQPSTTTTIGFFTRDPIGFDGSEWGLYEFSNSRSLTMVDPSGTVCQQPCVPRDKTTCCADAFKLAVNGGMQGRAFCCDGGMVACVWGQNLPGVNPAAKSLMEKCVQQHEDQHVRDSGPCPKGCPRLDFISYSSGYTDAMSECLAIKLMLRCLIAARRQCAQTPGCDPAEITFYINRDVLPRGKIACRMAGMVEP